MTGQLTLCLECGQRRRVEQLFLVGGTKQRFGQNNTRLLEFFKKQDKQVLYTPYRIQIKMEETFEASPSLNTR